MSLGTEKLFSVAKGMYASPNTLQEIFHQRVCEIQWISQ